MDYGRSPFSFGKAALAPAYFSHLLSGILLLWWFLEIYGKRRKNPGEKLDWFERFDLFFLPLASLIAFYTFRLQMLH